MIFKHCVPLLGTSYSTFFRVVLVVQSAKNGFNRNDKQRASAELTSLNLFLWFLHLSWKWVSIERKRRRPNSGSPCSNSCLVLLLASFSADLELRKLVAIKVGCKWPLKVYVAREKNHFLQSTAAARKFSPQLKSHYHPQDIHPIKNSGRQKYTHIPQPFSYPNRVSQKWLKSFAFGGKNTSFR